MSIASALRFYRGTGRTGGPVLPMDDIDAQFWANRHRAEKDRLDRIKAKGKTNDQCRA